MNKLPGSDFTLARTWLSALERAARDRMGVFAREFLLHVYERAGEEWMQAQSLSNQASPFPCTSPVDAIQQYTESSATSGLLRHQSDIEVKDEGHGHLKLLIHRCPYKGVCQDLLDNGLQTAELTCPRIGCLRGAIKHLSHKEARYELEEFIPHGHCRGSIKVEE